jgi:hypothetical protein
MDQSFRIVQVEAGGDDLVASASNFLVARAAHDTAVSLWPKASIELRQGAGGTQESRATAHDSGSMRFATPSS